MTRQRFIRQSPAKTDNSHLKTKLEIRRHFLERFHAGDSLIEVLDCCQGDGVIWSTLKIEYRIARYWGVDLKRQRGRISIDSSRILAQPGLTASIVDIDTYGSPWKHWCALLPNIHHATTVFLTIGQRISGTVGNLPKECFEALGIGFWREMPAGFRVKLAKDAVSAMLATACDYATIEHVAEGIPSGCINYGNARYVGIRLLPKQNGPHLDHAGLPSESE